MSGEHIILGPRGEELTKIYAPPATQTKRPYGVLPIELLTRRDITMAAKAVTACVFYVQGRGDIKGDLVDIVAELCAVSRAKARGYLVELENAGVLRRRLTAPKAKAS